MPITEYDEGAQFSGGVGCTSARRASEGNADFRHTTASGELICDDEAVIARLMAQQ